MNAFADAVFSFLLGWLRIPGAWIMRAAESGEVSSFSVWLGDHWIQMALIVCILGTVLDFAVWLARWKPYVLWRSRFRHFGKRRRGEEMRYREQRTFSHGYTQGVDFQFPNGENSGYSDNRGFGAEPPLLFEEIPQPEEPYFSADAYAQPQDRQPSPAFESMPKRRRRSDRYKGTGGEND